MTAAIVKLPTRRRRLVDLVDSPVAIKLVQEELLRAKGTSYGEIAAKARLGKTTVANIATGTTRWPRLETIIRILSALEWKIVAQRSEP